MMCAGGGGGGGGGGSTVHSGWVCHVAVLCVCLAVGLSDKSLHLPIPGQGPRKVISVATSGPTHARPRQAMPPAKGRPSPRKGGRGGASASEFYGAATSRILGKDGSNNRSLG